MRLLPILIAGTLLELSGTVPVLAQPDILTRAEVYQLVNQAQLLPRRQKPRPAKLADILVPLDAIQTAARSRAELLFNEGTLARMGANTIFRFTPGTRSFQLAHGTILTMIEPGHGMTTIITPEAIAVARGTALWGSHDSASKTTRFGALTTNPAGPLIVSNRKGEGIVRLKAGQAVSVTKGVVGSVQNFKLPAFYQTCELATDLAPGQAQLVTPAPLVAQQTFNTVQAEITAALIEQSKQPEIATVERNQALSCAVQTQIPPAATPWRTQKRSPGIGIDLGDIFRRSPQPQQNRD